ncbi:MAG: Uncharacterised protein [Cryomorphaceae bacterium]|nr:MAG: Uncharacterised protein [Cryomorphaceae bacterium]
MEVYNGLHLIIEYEKENLRLISTWKSNPPFLISNFIIN